MLQSVLELKLWSSQTLIDCHHWERYWYRINLILGDCQLYKLFDDLLSPFIKQKKIAGVTEVLCL